MGFIKEWFMIQMNKIAVFLTYGILGLSVTAFILEAIDTKGTINTINEMIILAIFILAVPICLVLKEHQTDEKVIGI